MSIDWRARAAAVIPGGSSTGSKRPASMFGLGHAGPTHITEALGCRIHTTDGDWLIDLTSALGAVALGYADRGVSAAVAAAALRGPAAGLSYVDEVTLAERLCQCFVAAEQVRFLKTGAEACAAAIRIARAHTGRDRVLGSGYFGWLDWWTNAAGVPAGAHADYLPLPFNDRAAWHDAFNAQGDRVAAAIVEPVVEAMADADWLQDVRTHCDRIGAVFIIDEIKTGFRIDRGGAQSVLGVVPDLTVVGKALANGYPLAAVVGKAAIMEATEKTWISSTLATELTALAAAHAVLDRHDSLPVCSTLASTGRALRSVIEQAATDAGRELRTTGHDAMFVIRWPDQDTENRTLAALRDAGVLAKRGAYQFATTAMAPDDIAAVGDAFHWALTH
jgi:glutamate-1-semialdehyde 2,1-aminomutase